MKTTALWIRRQRRRLAIAAGIILCVAGVGLYLLYLRSAERQTIDLRVSPGSRLTTRHRLANLLSQHAGPLGLRTRVVETRGSEETLAMLEEGTLDVGLISGGFRHPPNSRTQQLATIGAEPLHCLVRGELFEVSQSEGLSVLRGKRVHVGIEGGGAFSLATELIAMAGLRPLGNDGTGDYEQLKLTHDQLWALVRAVRDAENDEERRQAIAALPDVVFLLNPLPAATAQELMVSAGFKLRPLPYAEAFHVHAARWTGPETFHIERRLVRPMTIPAHSYGLAPAAPETDIQTFGVSTLVVVRPGLPKEAIQRLIKVLYESPFAGEVPSQELSAAHFEYPAPASLLWYFDSRSPVVLRDFVETMQNALSVFGAFSAGVFTVYGYYRRRKGRSAETYAAEINALEHAVWELLNDENRNAETLLSLRRCESELALIKRRILEDYTHGRLPGDVVFSSLLSLIADARATLVKSEASLQRDLAGRRPRRAEGDEEGPRDTYLRRAAG